jgi:CBS domain containing-hemolysin-like protein
VLLRILSIIVLVLLNGFFVGAEFALVRSRKTRLEAMARAGDTKARWALKGVGNISRLLSASQLGVTLASLGLGWVAEAVLGELFENLFGRIAMPAFIDAALEVTIASVFALVCVTYLHVVFGELAPKAAALRHPEGVARWLAPPLMAFAWVMTPFTILLNRSAQIVLRGFGERGEAHAEEGVHSPEELRMLVEQSQEGGALLQQDADLIEGVFEFSEKNARKVMTPRTDIIALDIDATLAETLRCVEEGGFSRYPVYEESIDNVVGLVLAKDFIKVLQQPPEQFVLAKVMREVHVVPGSREVEEVLADFKRLKEHMAIVLDEYGGTAGLVTMDDLLEEIVGEILDEYDEREAPEAAAIEGQTVVPGAVHIADLNDRFGLVVPDEDYTTIGGFVFGALGRLPVVGDRVSVSGAVLTVREMTGRRVETLALELDDPMAAETAD